MPSLVEVALINAVLATALAVIAAVVGFCFSRQALTHVVWIVVLLKLISPPLFQFEVMDREWFSLQAAEFSKLLVEKLNEPLHLESHTSFHDDPLEQQASQQSPRPRVLPPANQRESNWFRNRFQVIGTWLLRDGGLQVVSFSLMVVWFAGTFIWFVLQGWRCLQFRNAMSRGRLAPAEIQAQFQALASRSGCKRAPAVWLMPGTLSPMLWSVGRTTLVVFPEALISRLAPDSRETLLAHELAHFQRGDHWVRLLSLLVTGLFWWHPITWLARCMIESAEEECCDAWVVTRAAAAPRQYAEAILETVDFIAERRTSVPPFGTGLGQLPFLRQRLIWIMRGPRRQELGKAGRWLCITLAVLLPVQPTWMAISPAIALEQSLIHNDLNDADAFSDINIDPPILSDQPDSVGTFQVLKLPYLPSVGPSGSTAVSSSDRRFIMFVGPTRQWLVDRILERGVDLSAFRAVAVAFSPDGRTLVLGGQDGTVRLLDTESFSESHRWLFSASPVCTVDISHDETSVAWGCSDGRVRIQRLKADEPVRELPFEAGPVSCVRFSADDRRLAVSVGQVGAPYGGRIVVWETHTWTEVVSMNKNQATSVVEFDENEDSLLSGAPDGRIARWNLMSGELLGFIEGKHSVIAAAAVAPQSSRLAEQVVPDLPVRLLVGDAAQDEQVKSLWDQLTTRASLFRRPLGLKPQSGDQP